MRLVLLLLGLACCSFRDDFSVDGPLRSPWSGDTAGFVIEAGALRSLSDTRSVVYDSVLPKGQVAWARWSGLGGTEMDIVLRAQGTSFPMPQCEIRYDHEAHLIRVATYTTSWTTSAQWACTLAPGDTVTALSDSTGKVLVWRNKSYLGTASLTGWPYATSPGRAGVTMNGGRLDWFAASAYPVPPATPETIPPSAILSWTFPSYQAGPDGCSEGTLRESKFCGFVIEMKPDTVGGQWTCGWKGAWGMPGGTGRVGIPMEGVARWFRIAAIDSAGNQAECWSNVTRVP